MGKSKPSARSEAGSNPNWWRSLNLQNRPTADPDRQYPSCGLRCSWVCAMTRVPKNACCQRPSIDKSSLRTENRLFDVFHRQQRTVVVASRIDCADHNCGESVSYFRVFCDEGFNHSHIALIRLVGVGNTAGLIFQSQIQV